MRVINNKTVMTSDVLNHHQPSALAGNMSNLLRLMREAEQPQVPADVPAQNPPDEEDEQQEPETDQTPEDDGTYDAGYNQALDDIVSLVKSQYHMGPNDIDSMFTWADFKQSVEKLKKPFGVTGPGEKV